MTENRLLVVGRLRKPHGLKGDVTVFPLTDDPQSVFAPGRELITLDLSGQEVGSPVVIERSRQYHREWLIKFLGRDSRESLETLRDTMLASKAEDLTPPGPGEVYIHDLAGFAVSREDGTALGLVSAVYELPGGLMLEVQGPRREFLLPYKAEFIRQVDPEARRLVVAVPEGLLDL